MSPCSRATKARYRKETLPCQSRLALLIFVLRVALAELKCNTLKLTDFEGYINPLTPMSDQQKISPYNNCTISTR